MLMKSVYTLTACTLTFGAIILNYDDQRYNMPINQAHSILKEVDAPLSYIGADNADSEYFKISNNQIVWKIVRYDGELMRFIATLENIDNVKTEIDVRLEGAASGKYKFISDKLSEHETIRSYYEAAMNEQIAAALEGRDYDITSTYPAMMLASGANMDKLHERFDRNSDNQKIHNTNDINDDYDNSEDDYIDDYSGIDPSV